jgi:glycosyltransferase involved in cell wall biosynthesis
MTKSAAPKDGVTVVIPAHNAAPELQRVLPAWGAVLTNLNRPFEILVVNDGSTDGTAAALDQLVTRVPHLRVLRGGGSPDTGTVHYHDTRRGFGACLRTALAEAKHPLFMYAGVDYPYTPTDIKQMLVRIELRDEILGKQPDLISGARAGQPRPLPVTLLGGAWKIFWRVFAGLPMAESPPWYGWSEWWYRVRVGWVFGVPLADVNSAFKLYRTAFLKRFPIQSDSDFVHTELVAKATFLTSIMDEIPITPQPHLPPPRSIAQDWSLVFRNPIFAFEEVPPRAAPPQPEAAPAVPPLAPNPSHAPLA